MYHSRSGFSGKEFRLHPKKADGKIRCMAISKLGKSDPRPRADRVRQTRVDLEKKFLGTIIACRIAGVRMAKAQAVFLISRPKIAREGIAIVVIAVGVMIVIIMPLDGSTIADREHTSRQ